jgi:hypothetical protein
VYKKLMPFVFMLFTGNVLANEPPIEIIEYIDDVKIIAYINESDLGAETQWIPFKSPPPLSISDALQAVDQYIKTNSEFTHATLIGIELKEIARHENIWHYLVRVKGSSADKTQAHFYVVLMNGKVISGIRRPDSIK